MTRQVTDGIPGLIADGDSGSFEIDALTAVPVGGDLRRGGSRQDTSVV
jgi:hypothetical protein